MKNKNYYQKVINYFNDKADAYDDVDNQLYWVLSDVYFQEILKKEIPNLITDKQRIHLLDAGAGTGRWSLFFYDLFKDQYEITGKLIDISDGMLKVAQKKIQERGLDKNFECSIGNIEEITEIPDNNIDLSLSFYNVISFVEKPQKALIEIHKKLKKGGIHISIVANKYHSYYFSILTNRLKELDGIQNDSKIKFNDNMPYIHCFTPEELKDLYISSGYKEVTVLGGPNFIYPGMEETFVHGSTESIQNKLENKDTFNKLLEIELANYKNTDVVGRGNVLMAIAKK